jgi:hypothetical protein
LEIIAYAKKNNAMNMGQLYCGKMKKVHCNLQCGNNQLMCSKFKTCVMPHNEGLRARMWAFERNGSNLKAKMFLDNNISIYQVHQTWIPQIY